MKLIINVIHFFERLGSHSRFFQKEFPASENLFDFQRVLNITQKQLEMLQEFDFLIYNIIYKSE